MTVQAGYTFNAGNVSGHLSLESLRTLRPRPYLLKLLPDRLFRKPPSLPSQHASKLLVRLSNLFTHRDQAFGDIAVLFPQEQIRQFDEI